MPERLYFAVRADLSEGSRAAQLVHAMGMWSDVFEPHQGTVVVYAVPDEPALRELWDWTSRSAEDGVLWMEPDLGEFTALATTLGPLELPLLGQHRRRKRRIAS